MADHAGCVAVLRYSPEKRLRSPIRTIEWRARLLLPIWLALLLAGCGAFEVGLVPTPTPTPAMLRYENPDYGFAFTYPSHWSLEEAPQIIRLRNGSLELRIAYKNVNQAAPLPLADMTAADGSVSVGKLLFLGQAMPAEAMLYDRKVKSVLYHVPPPTTADDPEFSIFLKDTAGDESMEAYEAVDITDAVVAEVGTILESFEHTPVASATTPTPVPTSTPPPAASPAPAEDLYAGWARYVNAEYEFAFRYPITWQIAQVAGGNETPFGLSADAVRLSRDDLLLDIQVQRPGEDHFLGETDVAAGDLAERGTVTFLGETVPKHVLVLDGEDKALSLHYSGEALEFYIALGADPASARAYDEISLSERVQAEVDRILGSFELIAMP